ncbi:MAG: hypothetical protein A3E84_01330 [Gammaproteobacteria bacterium RIFCSPHIGHO2_12_FULL_42_13]|nr:MAG: hypothetical protein A3E84_01330 [Gammaproteobacteria bacterium RIFCSPHIGHO2_12_FULL_42_13]
MQARDLRAQLLDAVNGLKPYASDKGDATRLYAISKALSQADIPVGDHFKVAVFIFLLFAELQPMVIHSQELKRLFGDCDQALSLKSQHTPPAK